VDNSRALAAGLRCRPLPDTVSQTWNWMTAGGAAIVGEGEAGRASDHGLPAEEELRLLDAWQQRAQDSASWGNAGRATAKDST